MAERSKAPDLRLITSQHTMGAGVLVSEWRRGFEYHSWQCCIFTTLFFCIFRVGLHQIQRPCKECYSTQYRGNWLRPSRILQNERGYRDSGWSRYPNTEKFDREAHLFTKRPLSNPPWLQSQTAQRTAKASLSSTKTREEAAIRTPSVRPT